jgi:hypothetical protein
MEVAAPCPRSPDEQGLYVLPIDPVFEVRGRFRGYQTQETLARDVFFIFVVQNHVGIFFRFEATG